MLTYLLAYLQLYLQCKYATLLRACRRFDLLLGLGILLHQLRCLMCETMAAGHTTAGMNMQNRLIIQSPKKSQVTVRWQISAG